MASPPTDLTNINPYAVFPALAQPNDCDIARQPIVLQGVLSLGQLLRAAGLGNHSHLRGNRLLMAFVVLSLLGAVGGISLNHPESAIGAVVYATIAGLAIFALTCMDGTSLLKFCFYIGLDKPEPFRCTVSDDGVRTEFSRLTLDDPWSRFSAFSESDNMIVLWRKAQYIPLPKEFCSGAGDWERLRDVLHTRLTLRRS